MKKVSWILPFSSGCFILLLISNNLRHGGTTRTAMLNLRSLLLSLAQEEEAAATTSDGSGASAEDPRSYKNKKKRAFVCITGQLQRLILKPKYQSILEPILQEGFQIDVALVITGEESKVHYTNKVHDGDAGVGDFDTFQDAIEYLKTANTNITVLTPKPTKSKLGEHPKVPKKYLKSLDSWRHTPETLIARGENHARIYESLSKCYDAMTSRTTTSTSYQVLIRVRDDVAMDPPLDFKSIYSMMTTSTTTTTQIQQQQPVESTTPKDNDNQKTPPSTRLARAQVQAKAQVKSEHRAITTPLTIWISDCRCWGGMNDRLAILSSPKAAAFYFKTPHERFQAATDTTRFYPTASAALNPERFLFDTYHNKHKLQILATSRLRYIYKYHYTTTTTTNQTNLETNQQQQQRKVLELVPGENKTFCNLQDGNPFGRYGYHQRKIFSPVTNNKMVNTSTTTTTTMSATPSNHGGSSNTSGIDNDKEKDSTEMVWIADLVPKYGIPSSSYHRGGGGGGGGGSGFPHGRSSSHSNPLYNKRTSATRTTTTTTIHRTDGLRKIRRQQQSQQPPKRQQQKQQKPAEAGGGGVNGDNGVDSIALMLKKALVAGEQKRQEELQAINRESARGSPHLVGQRSTTNRRTRTSSSPYEYVPPA